MNLITSCRRSGLRLAPVNRGELYAQTDWANDGLSSLSFVQPEPPSPNVPTVVSDARFVDGVAVKLPYMEQETDSICSLHFGFDSARQIKKVYVRGQFAFDPRDDYEFDLYTVLKVFRFRGNFGGNNDRTCGTLDVQNLRWRWSTDDARISELNPQQDGMPGDTLYDATSPSARFLAPVAPAPWLEVCVDMSVNGYQTMQTWVDGVQIVNATHTIPDYDLSTFGFSTVIVMNVFNAPAANLDAFVGNVTIADRYQGVP